MNKNLEKIRDYLIERGVDEKSVDSGMTSSGEYPNCCVNDDGGVILSLDP